MNHTNAFEISPVVTGLLRYAELFGDPIGDREDLWAHELTTPERNRDRWWVTYNPRDKILDASHPVLGEFRIRPGHFIVFVNETPRATFTLFGGRSAERGNSEIYEELLAILPTVER